MKINYNELTQIINALNCYYLSLMEEADKETDEFIKEFRKDAAESYRKLAEDLKTR